MIKEHPILFSAELVKANLDGTKTMTRRIMNPQPDVHPQWEVWKKEALRKYKYQVGDLLWVRETWARVDGVTWYKADGIPISDKWKSPRFMFKEFTRIWLEITSIKIERVQDISEEDAMAEGAKPVFLDPEADTPWTAKTFFEILWNKINGKGSWDANPFVWVIEYKVISKTGKP